MRANREWWITINVIDILVRWELRIDFCFGKVEFIGVFYVLEVWWKFDRSGFKGELEEGNWK